jgi:dihydroorotase
MSKFILTESQYQKLVEQVDSNRAAMDLDIYSQPMTTHTDNGNLDIEDAVTDIISKMEELKSMLKSGKQVHSELKNRIFKGLDQINAAFSNIKYAD